MAPARPRPTSGAEMAANVAASARAATEALVHLEDSLQRGGFADGAAVYERMADVLLSQRMWAESEGVAVGEDFETLGTVARRVFALLEPYTTTMKRLAVLAPADHELARRHVLDALTRRGNRGATVATLARELRMERATLDGLLGTLVDQGVVTVRGRGGAALFAVVAPRQARATGAARDSSARGRRVGP